MKRSLIFAAALLFGVGAYAKGPNNIEGKTVPHVKIRDLQNQPIDLPYLGKAPLLLFTSIPTMRARTAILSHTSRSTKSGETKSRLTESLT